MIKELLKTESEEEKKRRFDSIEEKMKVALKELKDSEMAVDIGTGSNNEINPDVAVNKTAEEVLVLIEKVTKFLGKEQFAPAETLLRYIYRISPSMQARTAIASARRLCHQSLQAEGKWVKRRATLLRRKESKAVLRDEKSKYMVDNSQKINDLLSTAILEISENIDRRGGEYFSKLHSMFEVILPPITNDQGFVLARAPVMFHTKRPLDERDFFQLMKEIHDVDPGLKKIERGFYLCKIVPIVGFAVKLNKPKVLQKAVKKLSEHFGRNVNLIELMFLHSSSELYWYTYDLPVKLEIIQFADSKIVEEYDSANAPLLNREGTLSRDEFVKVREAARIKNIEMRSLQLRSARERFIIDNKVIYDEIIAMEKASEEISVLLDAIKQEFATLTSNDITDEGKAVNGLAISSYKKLYHHMLKLYRQLSGTSETERDRLHSQLFEDRLKARELYYTYKDLALRKAQFLERRAFLKGTVDQYRDIARGTGRNLAKIPVL